jgi:hypothetical protein
MTELELRNKIAKLEKNVLIVDDAEVLAVIKKNLKDLKEKLAALQGSTPSTASSGGSSELEKLYAQRETFTKGLSSDDPLVAEASKRSLRKVNARIAELEGASPAPAPSPAPARRGRMPKAEQPEIPVTPARRGRPAKSETPTPAPARRGRPAKSETPAGEKPKIKRGRKPKAPSETPAKTTARRGRPALPQGARSQEVSIESITKLAGAVIDFCVENGIENPTLADVHGILSILDKGKVLKYAKGGKISRSGKYLSKWQIKQILTDGGMKIGSDEILSGVWLKKKDSGVAQMRMGGEVGYFVIDDDILDSGKSVMLGNRRISAKNKKFQGVFQGKMVGGVMKVYDYDDEMWKAVNPNEWQQAYAEGGGVGDTFSMSKMIMDNGKFIEMVIAENVSVAEFEKLFSDKGYEKRFDVTLVGFHFANPNGDTYQLIPRFHKRGEIISYAKGGGVGRFKVGVFNEQQLRNQEDKKAVEKAKKETGLKYVDTKIVKKGGKMFMEVYLISDEDYISSNKFAEGGGVGGNTITDLKDFDPNTTEIIDGDANFGMFPNITDLGVLSEIRGDADFFDSQVEDLGNLQIIRGDANFTDSILEGLGELHTIGGRAEFANSQIRYFRRLRTIGGNANFQDSQVEDLGTLQEIGGNVSFGFSQVENLGDLVLIGGFAEFTDSEVQDLGNLQFIGEDADFSHSQVRYLGNLEKIGGTAYFNDSQIRSLGNLQTIGGDVFWGERTDLQNEWEMPQGNRMASGGGVENFTLADYKENEETNNHSENALMLVKMYGTQDEIFEVERLIKKGEREGGFSMVDYRRMYEISNKYYKHLVEASKRK